MSTHSITRAASRRLKSCHIQWRPQDARIPLGARRSKSSSASVLDLPLPDAVRNAVKSSLLNEATKSDSSMWLQKPVNGTHEEKQIHNINTSSLSVDPLDEWYLDRTTRYWPGLPPHVQSGMLTDPFVLAESELSSLSQTIKQDLLGTDHPVLNQAASYFFDAADGGKKVRPMMVLLLSRALSESVESSSLHTSHSLLDAPFSWQRHDLPQSQRRLAEICEMIHTASLFHDDVIDGADTRRGAPAVHKVFGNKMAILAGDYLLARASISLARLQNPVVVECMSTIIEHLVRGEVMQLNSSKQEYLVYYLRKNFYKTASLMANSCKSAALLGDYDDELVEASYNYGKHVGMAFQLVDDILDFEGSEKTLGKPALSDLKAGLATAPVLFALESSSHASTLLDMVERKFRQEGDVEAALEIVQESDGMVRTKELAQVHAELAMESALELEESFHRDALVHLAYKVVDRTR